MSSSSSFNGAAKSCSSTGVLPIVHCPTCSLKLLRLVSKTERNPGRIFFKCPNYQLKKSISCNFFMWEEVYQAFLEDIGVIAKPIGGRSEEGNEGRGAANVIVGKSEKSGVVESIEMIKICAFINSILLMIIVLVMIIMLVVMLWK